MEWILFISLAGSVYSYFIYPALLQCIRPRRTLTAPRQEDFAPAIDLIITVHNEASRVVEKLENALELDYPQEKLTIYVTSDGSTDGTNEIVESYADRGVRLIDVQDRKGKENAQWRAIQSSESDIIVFSDVATMMPEDAIRKVAEPFFDANIGAVSSEDRFINDDGQIAGEGLYVKYEMWLRRLESERAGLVGLSGSFFAARREVCEVWDISSPSDFNVALRCDECGLVAISSPNVLGYYKDLQDPSKEYQRKVRTVLRGITALARHRDALNLRSRGLFALQVWSHKVMRWLVPWFLLVTAISSTMLYNEHWFYQAVFWAQIAFYGVALLAWQSEPARNNPIARIIFFFVQVNLSIAQAQIKYAKGERMAVWSPSRR